MGTFVRVILFFFFVTSVHAQEQISLQLLWKHQFQFAGYYMAIEKGFYAEEGLDVSLKEFDFGIDLVGEVTSGNSQFGVGRTSLLIDKNAGADVVAMFAAYQQSPLMLLSRKDSDILLSSDLKDRKIMITNDAKKVGEIIAMLLQAGITLSDFEQQQHSYNVQDLIDGKTDAIASYISNEPYLMDQQGVEYNIIHPKDYGFDMYSDILFTSREYIEKRPEIVDKFYRASIKGWMYAFDNIQETAQVIFDSYNSQGKSIDALVFEGEELKEVAFDKDGNFGTLSVNKFNEMAQVYLITGSIFLGYDFSDFVYRPPSNLFRLSQAELAYIQNRGKVKVCVNPNWYPYESFQNGGHVGMAADYLRLILGNLNIPFEVIPTKTWSETIQYAKTDRCEVIAGAMQTINRSSYLEFSHPYLSVPAVVALKADSDAQSLPNMTIGVVDKSAFHDILRDRYPGMTIVPVRENREGIRMLLSGEIDGFVGGHTSITHVLRSQQIDNIVLSDQLRDNWDISVAVGQDSSPYLMNAINKSIASISAEEHKNIYRRWAQIEHKHSVDYRLLWGILAVVAVLAGLGLYRYLHMLSYNKMLQTIAEKDALTGILSRGKLRTELEEFTSLAQRHDWKLSLIFFDIDDFKGINDTYGHVKGDKVLIELTALVSAKSRKTDRFGRWGGEEFLFLMLETDLQDAGAIAEKFRGAIEKYDFGLPEAVTSSFGVAQYSKGESIESWVGRADSALYRAKGDGKNCVRLN
ncbi:ABC transporter substrate-binding protein [Neptuniibacter sp. QD37_6]|uniref:ABC transporter substrate-binding protein n=1 Tax=Neptuniibacter sp. QD37_6 TaxID=3398210 RepID=UPI0039F55B45